VHLCCQQGGFEKEIIVANALLNMYAKCEAPAEAQKVFDELEKKDIVSWTTIVSAYSLQGQHEKAYAIFKRMDLEGVRADRVSIVTLLEACCSQGALETGKVFHDRARESGLNSILMVRNAVINMYGKCGSLQDAREVFDKMDHRDVISWNTIIGSYAHSAFAQHGRSIEAVTLFREMLQEDIPVDKVTFVNALAACSHGGLTEEAAQYFTSLVVDFELQPSVEHYGCMVDLLGRLGWLEEAEKFIAGMPVPANSVILATFLAACRMHGDIARAKRVVEKAVGLNPGSSSSSYVASSFVALSSIYAEGGEFEDAASSRKRNRDR
ncbi:hypothetical protein SELMODRAFT_34426, partial [Selaginella moellendorffii]